MSSRNPSHPYPTNQQSQPTTNQTTNQAVRISKPACAKQVSGSILQRCSLQCEAKCYAKGLLSTALQQTTCNLHRTASARFLKGESKRGPRQERKICSLQFDMTLLYKAGPRSTLQQKAAILHAKVGSAGLPRSSKRGPIEAESGQKQVQFSV